MDYLILKGPCRLEGTLAASGAKNAALPVLAATILARGNFLIRNVPHVADVVTMLRILRSMGAKAFFSDNKIEINTKDLSGNAADYRYVSTMRASVCLLGPLLARFGKAVVSLPGGCVIGPRPINLHLKGLRLMGADVDLDHGYIVARARGLKGTRVYLGGAFGSSVLATANLMMAACRAKGRTMIEGAACEPEVVDLGRFLNKMGAQIRGLGSPLVEIEGVKRLTPCEYEIISDRIEAGSYMIAAAITKGDVTIKNVSSATLGAVIDKLKETGVTITERNGAVRARRKGRLKAVSVTTLSYPGFPTDLQAQMTALMCMAEGISVITEKIFPERFMHVAELNRMGALIRLEGPNSIIEGTGRLSAAPVMASDLRASAALVLAGLVAEGTTEIARVYHLDRGYERLTEKLTALGAHIRRERR